MMDSSFVSEYLESVFYARTPPKSADMKGAFDICNIVAADKLLNLFKHIKAWETHIFQVRSAWDDIPDKYFGIDKDRSYFESIAIREGFFKELVKIKAEKRTVDSFLFESMTKSKVIGLQNYRQVLHAWIEPIKLKRVDTRQSQMDIEKFKRRLREKMAENRKAFEGKYKDEINALMGLSKSEIDSITPDLTDLEIYDQLITVVKEASRVNLAQAELKSRIEELGEIAIKIAEKVPTLASMFV